MPAATPTIPSKDWSWEDFVFIIVRMCGTTMSDIKIETSIMNNSMIIPFVEPALGIEPRSLILTMDAFFQLNYAGLNVMWP
jgi:hypothetical protein